MIALCDRPRPCPVAVSARNSAAKNAADIAKREEEALTAAFSKRATALGSPHQQTYWVSTISRDHVQLSVEGGFTQAGHGKASGLKRLKADDWLVYYSPKTSLRDGEPVCRDLRPARLLKCA